MKGYIIIVTGASSGIGKAIYEYYLEHPLNIVIGVSREGPDISIDLSKTPLTWEIIKKHCPPDSSIDLIVNAAGIMPFEESKEVFDINFWAAVNIMEEFQIYMRPNGKGCFINIASISGMRTDPELPIYAASKAALISYTKSMALKYAPHYRFNCISPGFFNTNLVPEKTPQEMIDKVPMQYEAEPYEIIPVVEMIFKSKYMTGSNIIIDGGDIL